MYIVPVSRCVSRMIHVAFVCPTHSAPDLLYWRHRVSPRSKPPRRLTVGAEPVGGPRGGLGEASGARRPGGCPGARAQGG
jgi:hypothetical protein